MTVSNTTDEGVLGRTSEGVPIALDLDRLIGSHACLVANSGGGKSALIRKVLETTHGRVQHIVLDVEDEFYTLREQLDYVIAGGDDGDVPATLTNAGGLARTALEHGFSLIVQLNDLGEDAPEFVRQFLDSLMSAPRDLWRPLLVVIDETQRFRCADDGSPRRRWRASGSCRGACRSGKAACSLTTRRAGHSPFAWFVWEHGHTGPPALHFLDWKHPPPAVVTPDESSVQHPVELQS